MRPIGVGDPDATVFPPGANLDEYRIGDKIDEGAFGAVHVATRMATDERVVIKFLRDDVPMGSGVVARVAREGQALTSIVHPNLVRGHAFNASAAKPWLAMEHLEGETLETTLKARGSLPLEEAIRLLLPIADALDALGRQGFVHRDVKPANIFIARERSGALRPVLLDLGLAFDTAPGALRITSGGGTPGTPLYMAPEQVGARDLDARADQWALAVVLYECLTGARPFEAASWGELYFKISTAQYTLPTQLRPDLPKVVDDVVTRAFQVAPHARFASARAMIAALRPVASPSSA